MKIRTTNVSGNIMEFIFIHKLVELTTKRLLIKSIVLNTVYESQNYIEVSSP